MKKDKLRFLALGFFLSALILSVFQLVGAAHTNQDADKAVLAESSRTVTQVESSKESISKPEAETSSEDKNEPNESIETPESSESSESSQTESDMDNSQAFVFVVQEGQPSSVVIENLHMVGLIDNPEEVQTYIDESDLANSIQYGSYELSKNMSYIEIIDIITIQ